jgi:hypothetical protein
VVASFIFYHAVSTTAPPPAVSQIFFGGGAGKPTAKVIDEVRDIYAFIGAATGTECIRS